MPVYTPSHRCTQPAACQRGRGRSAFHTRMPRVHAGITLNPKPKRGRAACAVHAEGVAPAASLRENPQGHVNKRQRKQHINICM